MEKGGRADVQQNPSTDGGGAARSRRPSPRERLRASTLDEIRAAAKTQIRTQGAAALSLRSVARDVGISNAGLYRYFASRDELLTDLITDAFTELAVAIETADAAGNGDDVTSLTNVITTMFDWSVENPVYFSLLFDTSVPGYAAPPTGPTVPAATRYLRSVATPLTRAWTSTRTGAPRPSSAGTGEGAEYGRDPRLIDDADFRREFARSWTRLHGVITLHLNGQLSTLGMGPADVHDLYWSEAESILAIFTGPPADRPST